MLLGSQLRVGEYRPIQGIPSTLTIHRIKKTSGGAIELLISIVRDTGLVIYDSVPQITNADAEWMWELVPHVIDEIPV